MMFQNILLFIADSEHHRRQQFTKASTTCGVNDRRRDRDLAAAGEDDTSVNSLAAADLKISGAPAVAIPIITPNKAAIEK